MAEEVHEEKLLPTGLDDLRGRTPEELRQMFELVDAHAKSLHQNDDGELRDLDEAEQSAFDLAMEMREAILNRIDQHVKRAEIFRRRPQAVVQAMTNIRYGLDDPAGDTRRLTNPEARDRALRVLDSRDARELSDAQRAQVERLARRDTVTARRILVTENDDYRSAWQKLVTEAHPILSPE